MKSNRRLIDIFLVVLISSFVGIVGGASYMYTLERQKTSNHISASNISQIDEVYNTIVQKYYDNVDENKLVEAAVSGMLSILDANTSYLDSNTTNNFNKKMKGEYYGVGIEALTIEEGVLVVSVVNDSPAYDSGIKANDIITKVDDIELANKPVTYFTELVSKTDKEMKLEIDRNGRILNISVKPQKVVIDSVTINKFTKNGKNIGYIKISLFALNTAEQFATKLKVLEETGIDSLIIDVRNNTGGYLSNATTILEMFMNKGDILYNTETKDTKFSRKDETDENRDYPIAILVNGASASASEVLTASLMENKNVEVIGTKTYGKGTVQETLSVLGSSMAKITTKKWLTPKGTWINEVGITPTIEVEMDDNDSQLEKAIEVLSKQ